MSIVLTVWALDVDIRASFGVDLGGTVSRGPLLVWACESSYYCLFSIFLHNLLDGSCDARDCEVRWRCIVVTMPRTTHLLFDLADSSGV